MPMKFDKVISEQYGIMKGNGNLIFIKTGRGGTIYGYQNKYCRIASEFRDDFGCTVIVSANPENSECDLVTELNEILSSEGDFTEIYFIGVSNGALVGAQQGYRCKKIKAMLLVNGPLMINWHKARKGLEEFDGEKVQLVYGSLDPSYPYIELLDLIESEICDYVVLEGIDHNFTDNMEVFISNIWIFLKLCLS